MLVPSRRALSLAWVAAFAACGCDNEVMPVTGGSGGGATTSSTTAASTGTGVGMPGDGATIAITKLRMGSTSNTAWQSVGLDVDGVDTSVDFAEHCKPNQNASAKTVFQDGPGGVDNSYGKHMVPILKSAGGSSDFEASANTPIAEGKSTLMLDLANLGTGASQSPVTVFGLTGTNHATAPETWDIVPESLSGSTPDTSKMTFASATLMGNTLLATGGTVTIAVGTLGPTPMRLTLRAATVRAALSADHTTISNGILAGVLDTEEFIAVFKNTLANFSPDLCQGEAIMAILNQARQASDIMNDGTQSPAATCNGISIGLGFEGAITALGPLASPAPADPDPCVK